MEERTRHNRDGKQTDRPDEDRVEQLLAELRPVDLPPFFRTRLLARARAAGERQTLAQRMASPRLAWSIATLSLVALVVVVALYSERGEYPVPGGTDELGSMRIASAEIDPLTPVGDSVVGAGDVEIVAAIDPPVPGGLVRLYVDDVDVTGLAEVTDSYVMYNPPDAFTEGEHIITIVIRDAGGAMISDVSWLFYAMDGQRAPDERV